MPREATKGRLGPADDRGLSDTVTFDLNPEKIIRRRMPQYSEVGAALADYTGNYKGPSPIQWVRNPPENITLELLLNANGDKDVEATLKKFEKMQSRTSKNPQGKSGEPPDLVFVYGRRSDRVRITSYEVTEERHTSDLRVQRAHVKLDLKTVVARI